MPSDEETERQGQEGREEKKVARWQETHAPASPEPAHEVEGGLHTPTRARPPRPWCPHHYPRRSHLSRAYLGSRPEPEPKVEAPVAAQAP